MHFPNNRLNLIFLEYLQNIIVVIVGI